MYGGCGFTETEYLLWVEAPDSANATSATTLRGAKPVCSQPLVPVESHLIEEYAIPPARQSAHERFIYRSFSSDG